MVAIAKGNFFAGTKKAKAMRVPPAPKAPKKKKSLKIALLIFFSVLLMIMVGAVGFLGYIGFTPDDRLIFNNIMIYDTNLGGMSKDEAKAAIHQLTDPTYLQQDMVLNVNGMEIRFSPAESRFCGFLRGV